ARAQPVNSTVRVDIDLAPAVATDDRRGGKLAGDVRRRAKDVGDRVDTEQNANALDRQADAGQHGHHGEDRSAGNAGNTEARQHRRYDERGELRRPYGYPIESGDEQTAGDEAERCAGAEERRGERKKKSRDVVGESEPRARALDERRQRGDRRARRESDGLRGQRGAGESLERNAPAPDRRRIDDDEHERERRDRHEHDVRRQRADGGEAEPRDERQHEREDAERRNDEQPLDDDEHRRGDAAQDGDDRLTLLGGNGEQTEPEEEREDDQWKHGAVDGSTHRVRRNERGDPLSGREHRRARVR